MSASLAAAAVGTETDGSLVCPGSFNGIVALKPTVGLLSRSHIVPIAHSQDTPGPMTRDVADAAILLSAMAGTDPADPATAGADAHKMEYSEALAIASLRGRRLAVVAPESGIDATETDAIYAKVIAALKSAGAVITEIKAPEAPDFRKSELLVLEYELKHDLNAYFASLPPGGNVRSLADVITFNKATPRETVLFGQEFFEEAQTLGDLSSPEYIAAHDKLREFSRRTLDAVFTDNHVEALVEITADPAARIDTVPHDGGGRSASFFPATAGYPHLTVPMGHVHGLPVGISFIGPAWSEAKLLALGAAFERAMPARRAPTYIPSLESLPEISKAFAPNAH
jgi:amidase